MDPKISESINLGESKPQNNRGIGQHATHSTEPTLVIKTNLDPKDSTEDNPYYHNKDGTSAEKLREYFED